MKTLLHCAYVFHFSHEFIIIDQYQFLFFRDIERYKATVAGTWNVNIFLSPHNLVFSFSTFPLPTLLNSIILPEAEA